jgi:hypothetical protein
MNRTTVIIAGGRDFNDSELLTKACDSVFDECDFMEIVSGGARGADSLAEEYAKISGDKLTVIPADWEKYGRAAGPIRNQEMLDYIKEKENPMLIAFWDGKSTGTANMIKIAKDAGIKTRIFNY